MKVIFLMTVLFLATRAGSQSLVDALYGGKLKADTGAVIRKGDSLKIRENMAQKVTEDSMKKATAITDSKSPSNPSKEAAGNTGGDSLRTSSSPGILEPAADSAETTPTDETAAAGGEKEIPGDNNKIWKSFIDEFTATVKSEVLSSGKVKKGAYSVLINYQIGTDGAVSITSVTTDPKNNFMDDQIKQRLTFNAPQMNPVLGVSGKPRVVSRKQLLSFVK